MLRSLELAGFKSFADRTRFEFHPGVTAVVGPNGSGKSNVIDAVKWILGDQSPKSLRGKKMTDVIFNGSAGRKASGSAEATLTFCNKSGWLPGADRGDVSVGRKVWQNGDSEYLLNGRTALLKEVRDLFAGTGAGGATYAIIEQGRVAQLLEANAAGRRAVFEEAAGVSRFKAKRDEAERRLARTEQNLLRLTDVTDEVEAQLASTRSKARKAGEWKRLDTELRRWWIGLAADEWRALEADRAAARAQFEGQGGGDDGEGATLAAEIAALSAAGEDLDAAFAAADARRREADAAAQAVRSGLAADLAAAAAGRDRLAEQEGEAARLDRDRTAAAIRLAEAAAEAERDAGLLERANADLAERSAAHRAAAADLRVRTEQAEAARAALDGLRETRLTALRASDKAAAERERLRADSAAAEVAQTDADARLEQEERRLAAAQSAASDAAAAAAAAGERFRLAAGRLADLHAVRSSLLKAREKLARRLSELRERHGAGAARLAILDELDERGDGVGVALREVLRRARAATAPPWSLVRGTVAELLDCDLDDAALLEVALGERASLVVIDDFDALLPHLERHSAEYRSRVGYFSRRDFPGASNPDDASGLRGFKLIDTRGRGPGASFAPHSSPLPPPSANLNGLPGVVGPAVDLVAPGNVYPELAERLLGDTWVVETLSDAAKLSAGAGRGRRFVTRGGELLEPDGVLVVGPPRGEAALLTRTAERRRLRAELDRTAAATAGGAERREALGEKLAEVEAALDGATKEKEAAAAALAAAGSNRDRTADLRDAARDRRDAASGEAHHAAGRRDERAAKADAAAEAATEAAAALAAAEASLAEHTAAADAADAALTAERSAHAAAGLDLAKTEERSGGLRAAHDRLIRDVAAKRDALREADDRRAAGRRRRTQATLASLNAAARAAERISERDRLGERAAAVAVEAEELAERRRAHAGRLQQVESRRKALEDAARAAEDGLRDRSARLSATAERLREEYGVDLAEVAAAPPDAGGPSALAELAAERAETQDEAEEAFELPDLDDERADLGRRVDALRGKLRALGAVDPDSLATLEELEERHGRLSRELNDLVEAKRLLEDLIRRVNRESKELFLETFASIRGHFQTLFRQLFGGGEGDVRLEDESDPLECGVEVFARPPGKEPRNISLLSGGEKTIVCVGLLLAIFRSNPSPFCILDEVDAALDEANIGRFLKVMADFKKETQFLMVTHRKPSMCDADVLYGVTMQQSGVSKRLTVRFEDVGDDGHFKATAESAEQPPELRRAA
ncbi:AAA family ATPase [Alienimonas californiensis]|uniref:Chromosome partition protein Smc n=1 Tax=Alienimonas californiensis TaxID=2527989 RepID=A0A517P3L7_9PLAN|nr:AAA family ATPase [Alienimonas californiensis]QDT13966.1 Chromosome partition protein Smc [Alienimonas californiensis]